MIKKELTLYIPIFKMPKEDIYYIIKFENLRKFISSHEYKKLEEDYTSLNKVLKSIKKYPYKKLIDEEKRRVYIIKVKICLKKEKDWESRERAVTEIGTAEVIYELNIYKRDDCLLSNNNNTR